MPIYQSGPKTWTVRVQYRDRDNGEKRSLQRKVTGTKRSAERVELELLREIADGRTERLRLADYATTWMVSKVASLKPSVARKYATSLDLHIVPVLGRYYLDRLKSNHVQDYVSLRVEAGAAPNTIKNEVRVLQVIAKDSVADGYARVYWAGRVTVPSPVGYTEDDPNLLTASQLRQMIAHVPPQWRQLVALMAFTGLRWGEASALRFEDIDTKAGMIRVRRSNWKGVEVQPKTKGSYRSVPLPPIGLGGGTGHIFPARSGELHRGTPLRKVLEQACTAAKVPRITPHGLRRTFNNLARTVAQGQVVKSITGHTTDAMLEHYSLVGHDEKRRAQTKVVRLVEGKKR